MKRVAKIRVDLLLGFCFSFCRLFVLWYFGYKDWPYQYDLWNVLDTKNYDRIFEE